MFSMVETSIVVDLFHSNTISAAKVYHGSAVHAVAVPVQEYVTGADSFAARSAHRGLLHADPLPSPSDQAETDLELLGADQIAGDLGLLRRLGQVLQVLCEIDFQSGYRNVGWNDSKCLPSWAITDVMENYKQTVPPRHPCDRRTCIEC